MTEIVREKIEIAVADAASPTMGAYLARPAEPGDHPGVLVGFELFGLTSYVRDVADRVAAEGYVAIAPDFYHRAAPGTELDSTEEGRQRGFTLLETVTREGALADLEAARKALTDHGATGKAGMIGLSFGGHLAYFAATRLDLAAVAVFYGGWLTTTDIPLGRPEPTVTLTGDITGRVLYLVGDADHAVPAEHHREIGSRLAEAGVRHEVVVYPDTPHGFFCHVRDTYREGPADDAWRRTRELFATELR
ncbi:dienelactone hydrolase family protein [Amycolatopsis rhizosphaerae]|nr:dienelactone hydrolase family protein [Amycolatopsis rhizosphaerae]